MKIYSIKKKSIEKAIEDGRDFYAKIQTVRGK